MELNTMGNEKLRTYDEVNAEMQRLQVELDNAKRQEMIDRIRPWVGKVFSYVDSGFTKHFYKVGQITDGCANWVHVSIWTSGLTLAAFKKSNLWEIVSALDNFEVTEVPLETFKKIVKEEVEVI